MANGNDQTQQNAQLSQQPSLFRRILSGALLGLSGGLSAGEGEHPFTAGIEAVENARDRQLRREGFAAEQQRQDEALQIQKRRLSLDEQAAELRRTMALDDEQTNKLERAVLEVRLLKANRELELLPADKQEAFQTDLRKISTQLLVNGATIALESDDEFAAKKRTLELQRENPNTRFTPALPHPSSLDKFVVFELPQRETTTLQADVNVKLGNRSLRVPKGTPIGTALNLQMRALLAEFESDVEATREEAATKPLTFKDALTQARQEITALVDTGLLRPKGNDEIASAVNKRAKELLDLDAQLRRAGLRSPRNTIAVLGQLKALRQRGASDLELKGQIAMLAATGTLGAEEIIALYDQLGLSPSLNQRPPEQLPPGITPETGAGVKLPIPGNIRVPR